MNGSLRATLVLVAAALAGCTGDDADSTATTTPAPAAVVAQPSDTVAATKFCTGMAAVRDRMASNPPDDATAFIANSYQALLPEAPIEIASDLQAVINNLTGFVESDGVVAASTSTTGAVTTAAPDDSIVGTGDEGLAPDVEPELRLNSYLSAVCFGTQSNPGPRATQPN